MKKVIIIGLSVFILFFAIAVVFIKVGTSPVAKSNKTEILFTINNGDSRSTIINNLSKAGLVKNKLAGKIYINLKRSYNLQAATYEFDKSII